MKSKLLDTSKSTLSLSPSTKKDASTGTSSRDIAIIGMALNINGAHSPDQFWDYVRRGTDLVGPLPPGREDDIRSFLELTTLDAGQSKFQEIAYLDRVDEFDYSLFRLSPKEATLMDPHQRLFLETAWTALEDAGYGGSSLSGTQTGVFAGFSSDNEGYKKLVSMLAPGEEMQAMPGNLPSIIPSRISYLLDLKGPAVLVDTACSSALVALHLAMRAIRQGECSMAIAGAVKINFVSIDTGVRSEIESSDGRTHAFDDASDGTGKGEGVLALLLKPLAQAKKDRDHIHAIIKGSAVNQDGSSAGITAPNAAAQAEVLLKAWKDSGVDPGTISYIEAHGTGTKLGDPIEIEGLSRAFGRYTDKKQFCAIGSVKTNVGHLDSAAGLMGLFNAVLALKHKQIPPIVHFSTPNRQIDFEQSPVFVNTELKEWEANGHPRRCGVSSFGLSGTNCHVVLEEAPVPETNTSTRDSTPLLLTISAQSQAGLEAWLRSYQTYFQPSSNRRLDDACFTANTGKGHYRYRLLLKFDDGDALCSQIDTLLKGGIDHSPDDGIFYGCHHIVPPGKSQKKPGDVTERELADLSKEAGGLVTAYLNKREDDVLNRLAEAYVAGGDVPWTRFYRRGGFSRVPLPTYPFDRRRCWLEPTDEDKARIRRQLLETTIDSRYARQVNLGLVDACLAESEDIAIYSTVFSPAKHWLLREHKVAGRCVMVGTGYLEMAAELGRELFSEANIHVRDLVISSPMILEEEESLEVQIIVSNNAEGFDFRVVHRDDDGPEPDLWREYAAGTVAVLDTGKGEKPEPLDIPAIEQRLHEVHHIEKRTEPLPEDSFVWTGPRWDCLRTIHAGSDECLGKLELSGDFRGDLTDLLLHPPLIDTAIHIGSSRLQGNYLPLAYPDVKIWGQAPADAVCHVKKKDADEGETVRFDIVVASPRGEVAVQLTDYTLKRVHGDIAAPATAGILHQIAWVPRETSEKGTGAVAERINNRRVWVIGGGRDGWEDELLTFLKKDVPNLIGIKRDGDDWLQKVDAASGDIVLFLAIESPATETQADIDLFHLAQKLIKEQSTDIQLTVIANHAAMVAGDEPFILPRHAALFGLAKVIPQEYSAISCRVMDVDLKSNVESIIDEIFLSEGSPVTAVRRDDWFVQEFRSLDNAANQESAVAIRENGVYVITGGLGGIGLVLAEKLASMKRVNLALLGRTAVSAQNEALQRIEALGSTVVCHAVDVADPEALDGILAKARRQLGSIHGVIHCAGVAGKGLMADKDDETFRAVLKPKIQGTLALDRATAGDDLDFFILCSSLTALTGGPGQSDYTAANCFLDAFSAQRTALGKRTLSIGWTGWKEAGMALRFGADDADDVFKNMTNSEAAAAFEKVLGMDEPHILISPLDLRLLAEKERELPVRLSAKMSDKLERFRKPTPVSRQGSEPKAVNLTGREEGVYSSAERQVAGAWAVALGFDEIDIYANYYELGGDSISALTIVNQLNRQLRTNFSVADLFNHLTVEEFGRLLEERIGGEDNGNGDAEEAHTGIGPIAPAAHYPLSAAQKRLFILDQFDNNHTGYNLPDVQVIEGALDVERLRQAFIALIGRHESLRTSFHLVDGQPVQVVHDEPEFHLPLLDGEVQSLRQRIDTFIRPFDLSVAPLLRAQVIKSGDNRHVLMMDCHHIIADAMSCEIMMNELMLLYGGRELSPLPVQYKDFAAWQNQLFETGAIDRQKEYWLDIYKDSIPALDLPLDFPRPAIQSFSGDLVEATLEEADTSNLVEFSRGHGVTVYMSLLAALYIILHRYSRDGQEDIVVGSAVSGRSHADAEGLIGMFVNLLPIRNYPSPQKAFLTFLHEVKESVLASFANQDVQFDQLVEDLEIPRDFSRNPLADVEFSFMSFDKPALSASASSPGSLTMRRPDDVLKDSSKADITLFCSDGDRLAFMFEYCTALFKQSTIQRFAGHFIAILRQVLLNPAVAIGDIDFISNEEKFKLLHEFNDTAMELPDDETFLYIFIKNSAEHSHRIAMVDSSDSSIEERQITYGELNRQTDAAAGLLFRNGVKPGGIVPIVSDSSLDMIVAILAVLKAGVAYLPIDPAYPAERIRFMLDDCGATIALSAGEPVPNSGDVRWLSLEDVQSAGSEHNPPLPRVKQEDIAYIIYTSGSTGQPKGVLIRHRSLLNLCLWYLRQFDVTAGDRFSKYAGVSFDASVWELFPCFAGAAAICVIPSSIKLDLEGLNRYFESHDITVGFLPTPVCERFLNIKNHSLRILHSGGDRLKEAGATNYLLANIYGPAENTVCTASDIVDAGSESILIGAPMANTHVFVLAKNGGLQPIGVPGELWVAGEGLSPGYLNRPELTAERFIPLNETGLAQEGSLQLSPGEKLPPRLYRTGDLVRFMADGKLDFLGRIDRQVKIRGFRIELGEIENQLLRHSGVTDGAVLAVEDPSGQKFLRAFVSTQSTGLKPSILKDFLSQTLPDYMVPAEIHILESLPLTPNGKVDRKALASIKEEASAPSTPAAAQDGMETMVASVWQEVLGLVPPGIDDNFFEVGGTSLNIIMVNAKLKERLNRDIPVVDLFRHPTIRQLARYLAGDSTLPAPVKEAKDPEATTMNVAVIGMSCRFPGAEDSDAFWKNIENGIESIVPLTDDQLLDAGVKRELIDNPRYVKRASFIDGIDGFDADFFGYTPNEAQLMDPQIRIFHECVQQALEHAGYHPDACEDTIGLYAGASPSLHWEGMAMFSDKGRDLGSFGTVNLASRDFLCTRVAYNLNLRGPASTVQTACSTSLMAIYQACRGLMANECRMAVAGGVSVSPEPKQGYLYQEGMIRSSDGHCRAFDKEADGTVFGDGAGVIVLKSLAQAEQDGDTIYAVVKGGAANNDGNRKVGYTAPSVEGQAEVIRDALDLAGFDPGTISYIEAHGTGTTMGDPIEIAALTQAFNTEKTNYCAVGSVKTNIGHLDTAAGVAGFLKTALSLHHKKIAPSLHFKSPNPNIDFAPSPFYVNSSLKNWQRNGAPMRAGVSSFGIGGTNVHLILEQYCPPQSQEKSQTANHRDYHILPISAKTETALRQSVAHLSSYLKSHPEVPLRDISFTLQMGRGAYAHRRSVVCNTAGEALDVLSQSSGSSTELTAIEARPTIVFLFPGQGAQYIGMGKSLYDNEPIFRRELDGCFDILKPLLGVDLKQAVYPDSGHPAADINQTAVTQPLLVAFEYALARLLIHWGVTPAAMTGHSIGEYTAACLSGVLSLEDCFRLVVKRGELMQSLPSGAMLSVPLPAAEVEELLDTSLSLAAANSSYRSVVSGPHEAIVAFEERLTEEGIDPRRLLTSHAFHSAMMDPILDEFTGVVNSVTVNQPSIPYISNLSGEWITRNDLNDPSYWGRHLRGAVRFAEGAKVLLELESPIFLEVGPGNALSTFIRQHNDCTPELSRKVVNLVRHPREELPDDTLLLQQIGNLWQWGQSIDWKKMRELESCRRIPLPTYPFQRQRYWLDVDLKTMNRERPAGDSMPPRREDPADWFYIPSWRQSPEAGTLPEATDERTLWLVLGGDDPLTEVFVERLKRLGNPVVTVKRGASFAQVGTMEYHIDPADEDCFGRLVPELLAHSKHRLRIVHLWCYTHDDRDLMGFYSLLSLAKSLGEREEAAPVQLGVVTNGMQDITGEEPLLPCAAPLLGAIKTIPLEYPNISCCCLDMMQLESRHGQADSLAGHILREFASGFSLPLVAYRGRHRWIQTLNPHPLKMPETGTLPLKKGGVYLVTGKGGLGWTFAGYLAEHWKARLIIVSRSELTHPRKIAQIRSWEEQGAQIMMATADVADPRQMNGVVEEARERFGGFDGVIHTAGVADYFGVIQNRTRETIAEVLAPKVNGALVLDSLLQGEKLDFFLVCSSLGNTLYKLKFGQVGYQAANEFLEAFAAYRSANRHGLTIAASWIDWKEVGMTARASGSDHDDALLDASLTPAEGVDALQRLLGCGRSRISVSTMELTALEAYIEREIRRDISVQNRERPELESEFAVPGSAVEQKLAGLWKRFLGIDSVGVHDDFFALGGDSLLAVQLIARINDAFAKDFPSHILIKRKTIASLADLIEPQSQAGQQSLAGYVDTGRDSHMVEIQEGDAEVNPLFLIHPIGGHVYFYRDLAAHLPKELPVFGLQARGMDGATDPIESIGDMAALYLEEIERVRPHGPYRFGGASFGGLVAFELARILADRGQETELLFMGDTPAPGEYSKELADEAAVLAYLAGFTPQGKNIDAEAIRRMSPSQKQETIVQFAQNAGQKDPEVFLEQVKILIDIHGAHARAMENYHPQQTDNAIIYFQPLDHSPHNTKDPIAKWSTYTTGSIELHQVPGDHNTMNDPPNVATIGQILTPFLQRS